MKRILLIALTILILLSSLGHLLAAGFCPRMLGHDCCLTKTAAQHTSHHHPIAMDGIEMDGMQMVDMPNDDMTMNERAVHHLVMDDMEVPSGQSSADEPLADRFEQPIESCAHCMSHSGVPNAPVSFVFVPDQSKKDRGLVPAPGSRFLARPLITVAQSGPPREHAPPGPSAPRHILISVFLI